MLLRCEGGRDRLRNEFGEPRAKRNWNQLFAIDVQQH